MFAFPSELLLYPQTFLFPQKAIKIFPLVSRFVVIKLPETLNIMEDIYRELNFPWKEKIKFLEFKKEVKINWDQIDKEVKAIEDWGLNFRTPETLKYFTQFKETLEESLDEIFPTIKDKKDRERLYEEFEIKRALILLCLAERLDFKLYELEKSFIEMEEKYNKIFEERIIGEDYTFEKVLDIKETLTSYFPEEALPNLNLRTFAWKLIGRHIDWESSLSSANLLITEKELLEPWKEKFSFEKKEFQSKEVEVYEFKVSLFEILEISEANLPKSFSLKTGVVFIHI